MDALKRPLLLVFICLILTVPVFADGIEYTGDAIAIVNTCLEAETEQCGTFTVSENTALQNPLEDGKETCGFYVDEETGKTYRLLAPELRSLVPVQTDGEISLDNTIRRAYHYVGKIISVYDGSVRKTMKCLYTGQYCTVWGSSNEHASITMTAQKAAQIGKEFDLHCTDMVALFGQWFDADTDNKIAIFCHDIDSDYGTDPAAYTAGYFDASNMLSPSGRINGITFERSSRALGMDCIHLDTYPGMGKELNDISRSYSTLVHEFQHMINFSYQVKTGMFLDYMPIWLDEAFSMAAEHLIYGADTTKSRVDIFNNPDYYAAGTALTYWGQSIGNYSLSYLFGQYIRTRYAQTDAVDSSSIYRQVLEQRLTEDTDALQFISQLLCTTPQQLVLDFWAAVYLNAPEGVYGFNAESWAERIDLYGHEGVAEDFRIYNGGAVYCFLENQVRLGDLRNVEVLSFDGETVAQHRRNLANELALQSEDVNNLAVTQDGYEWKIEDGTFVSTNTRLPNSSSKITVSFTTQRKGSMSFEYGVSSETDCDIFEIVVDGTVVEKASGTTSDLYTTQLEAGDHTVSFEYQKDPFESFGYDRAWFRNLAVTLEEPETFDIAGANMTLGNDLKMNFLINKSDMQDGYTMRVSQEGREPVILTPESYNATYMYVAYSVAAKEMTDLLSVEVLDVSGNVVSNPFSRTIKQYAMGLMSRTDSKLKSVVVDMLNYGTEAQKYFGYREDNLANADLSDLQQEAYATKDVKATNSQIAGDNFVGANLSLEDRILLNTFFKGNTAEGMRAVISFVDYRGNKITAEAAVKPYSQSMVKVVIDKIVLADAGCPVTVTVYIEGTEYGSCVESVESYVARNITNQSGGPINMAIMKFAVSAYNYLGSMH